MHTKFDHYNFSHFRDIVDAHQNLNGSRDLTTPLSGMICHHLTTPLSGMICHPRARTCYNQCAYQIWCRYICPPQRYEKGYKIWKM